MKKNTFITIIILLCAIFLRFWNITNRGLYYHDETAFINNAIFYGETFKYFFRELIFNGQINFSNIQNKAMEVWLEGGTPWQRAKPLLHSLFILINIFIGSKEYYYFIASGICGVLSIFVITKINCFENYQKLSLISAFFATFSIIHLNYSRSGLSQSLSFLILSLQIKVFIDYQKSKESPSNNIYLLGFLTGLCFTTHYNLFWLPIFVVIWLGLSEWKRFNNLYFWLKRLLKTAFFMILPLLFFEIPTRIIMPIARRKIHDTLYAKAFSSYFEQIYFQITWFKEGATEKISLFYVFEIINKYEGTIFLILFIVSFVFLVWKSLKQDRVALLILLFAIIPLSFWTFFGFPAPRAFYPALLPVFLFFPMFLDFILKDFENNPKKFNISLFVSIGIISLNSILNIDKISGLLSANSPYKTASEKIIDYKIKFPEAYVTDSSLSVFNKPIIRHYLKKIVNKDKKHGGLFIIDPTKRLEMEVSSNNKIKEMELKNKPLFSIEMDLENKIILEELFYPDFLKKYENNDRFRKILIYNLNDSDKFE